MSTISQLKEFWDKLSLARKVLLIGVAVASIVVFAFLISWVREPEYGVLFSNLEAQDASKIIERLKERKIEYKLEDNGRTVLVPRQNVYELRLQFAGEGLPNSSIVGYEIFDKNNIGVSDFVQKINYKRALEGELARTILQIEGVEAVRVHIVMPEKTLFKEDQKEPTASVILKLKQGTRITRENVQSIAYLVANSVEGLDPKNVTILDSRGRLLSDNSESDPLEKVSGKQYELKRSVEQYLADKVQSLLDGVLGQGNSIVRVDVELNFTQVEKTIEEYDPDKTVVRSEQTTQERSSSVDSSFASTNSQRTNTITNYEVNRTLQRIVESVGNIKRLSVAVLVNGTYKVSEVDGVKKVEYIPRDEEQIQKLTEIVKNAVGFNPDRNDQISVVSIPFEPAGEGVEFVRREDKRENWRDLVEKIVIGFAILGSIVVIFSLLGRLKVKREIPTVEVKEFPQVQPQPTLKEPETVTIEAVEPAEEEIEFERMKREQIKEKVMEYIRENSEQATRLIKVWLLEEEKAKWQRR
ncbi:flagellar basal-body MS-ring/collar protein FliF [Candidatus Kryptobacter tengchongensis]|uniref:flagellar basal-body MS-ring/collar protein FliF n=1 Tax=Kryptobacter tengchongensis TaxID=1643429 RepID=UPI000707E08D|nr:flagellar basal-body MS-ring/collar protein FliF [Candidatus Kryptobacter tengchongensis]CUS91239.1 flagellar M-ring protein FliF [Candidatus Kryptobacter tengchongensis]